MNAIIALCHFCEAHGPGAVFCTQTLRETNIQLLDIHFDTDRKGCAACNSIGNSIGLVSKDPESNAHFVSSQVPVINETIELVKKAAFRSISSEVSSAASSSTNGSGGEGSGGGLVFFGDAHRGHVLSHTFHLMDSEARGFSKLFSIVILMKDKMFLLNIQPFLADCLNKISKELQGYAKTVHDDDLRAQGSQRAQRITQGYASNPSKTRSLVELTGKESIFAYLHAHFTFVLWAGARYLTESITLGSPSVPPWLGRDTEEGFTMVQTEKEGYLMRRMGYGKTEDESDRIDERSKAKYSLKAFRQILKDDDFKSVCFCVITGIQIVIRGPYVKGACLARNLKKMLPEPLHKLVRTQAESYKAAAECRIINLSQDAVAPNPSAGIMRIDLLDDRETVAVCVWDGDLPSKLPTLLQKILKAVDEELFTDLVLDKHLRALIEEWKNKVVCIRKMSSNQDVAKMKKILGIQPQDQVLINYWHSHL